MQDFKKLKVWDKSHQLTLDVYKVTANFPPTEQYGLTSQIRRASASIAANIAEGCGKEGKAELKRYLLISMGSASELQYHLILTHDLSFLESRTYEGLSSRVVEVKRMLSSFIEKLKA